MYNSFVAKQKSIGIFDLALNRNFVNQGSTPSSIVILSSFHLDKTESLTKLRILLERSSQSQPLMFVIMGELSSNQKIDTVEEFDEFNQSIESFIELLEEFPLH